MEGEVLDGAERTIRRRPPVLYVENNHRGRSPELVRRLFDLDYRCFWHTTSYFNPDNHDGVDRNVFERPFELNMVRSEEHTSELQSLMRTSYAVFCLKKKTKKNPTPAIHTNRT